jgi:alpha-L-fucosidase 2
VSDRLKVWFDTPAEHWYDALPVGNGRLGAMVYGGHRVERITLDESTFWSGEASSEADCRGNPALLAEIRQRLADGDVVAGHALAEGITGRKGNYGTNLRMGNLWLVFDHPLEGMSGYRRNLDLEQALAQVSYTWHGAEYRREVFASHPDEVLVVRLTCSRPGGLGLRLWLDGDEQPFSIRLEGDDALLMDCQARETTHSDGRTGVDGHVRLRVHAEGGTLSSYGCQIRVAGATAVTVLVAVATTWDGADPVRACQAQIAAASAQSYEALRAAHVADYQRLYGRASLDLGPAPHPDFPIDRRLAAVRAGEDDPHLCMLVYQFGRYLLISSSRHDSPLPAHLLGVWNDNVAARIGWTCDYHLDINTQMNYWIAELTGLSECHLPLFRWIQKRLVPSGRQTARRLHGLPGWVAYIVSNAWGYSAPGWSTYWGIFPTAGVWVALHLWDHYAFTGERAFLAEQAYPVLKEAAEFFLGYLGEDTRHGWLIGGPACSPENNYRLGDERYTLCLGPTVDRVLLDELFGRCCEAAAMLGIDADLAKRLSTARAKLPPYQIGRYGQLQEWLEDYEEATSQHRHTSHLLGLFPYDQITPGDTPDLAAAARTTMERRQSAPRYEEGSWARNNMTLFYARLEDGEAAYRSLTTLFRAESENSLMMGPRLAPLHAYEMDYNTGASAGIAEMLLQSKRGAIHLLPALPPAWPDGRVTGLCARGGFVVDVTWKQGRLAAATILSRLGGPCRLRAGIPLEITHDGAAVPLRQVSRDTVEFDTQAGGEYRAVARTA